VAPRATRSAAITASVPEHTNRIRSQPRQRREQGLRERDLVRRGRSETQARARGARDGREDAGSAWSEDVRTEGHLEIDPLAAVGVGDARALAADQHDLSRRHRLEAAHRRADAARHHAARAREQRVRLVCSSRTSCMGSPNPALAQRLPRMIGDDEVGARAPHPRPRLAHHRRLVDPALLGAALVIEYSPLTL
jgi:hypothetical protein